MIKDRASSRDSLEISCLSRRRSRKHQTLLTRLRIRRTSIALVHLIIKGEPMEYNAVKNNPK